MTFSRIVMFKLPRLLNKELIFLSFLFLTNFFLKKSIKVLISFSTKCLKTFFLFSIASYLALYFLCIVTILFRVPKTPFITALLILVLNKNYFKAYVARFQRAYCIKHAARVPEFFTLRVNLILLQLPNRSHLDLSLNARMKIKKSILYFAIIFDCIFLNLIINLLRAQTIFIFLTNITALSL